MNVACPECGTVFRVDPAKVPAGGVQARCSVCAGVMRVEEEAEGPAVTPQPAPREKQRKVTPAKSAAAVGADSPPPRAAPPKAIPTKSINPFLSKDPGIRAKRLARALISDMVTYYPEKREEGLREGTLKMLFKDEIAKSYEEYVQQVGNEFADSTSYFQDSLNELLASGKKVF